LVVNIVGFVYLQASAGSEDFVEEVEVLRVTGPPHLNNTEKGHSYNVKPLTLLVLDTWNWTYSAEQNPRKKNGLPYLNSPKYAE